MSGVTINKQFQKCKNLNIVPFLSTKFFQKKGTLFKGEHYLRKYGIWFCRSKNPANIESIQQLRQVKTPYRLYVFRNRIDILFKKNSESTVSEVVT